ncbi:MAG: hypothetical protein SVV80_01370 [Planctomycetota bacterium]|nr:hypothetical protein [Planctomycetota bacterium]
MLQITEPFDGAVLNHRNGRQTKDSLIIRVCGQADESARVSVNGVAASRNGAEFSADVALREKETDIVAVAEGPADRRETGVRVVWDRYSRKRYRFSIDDNSFFLRDITQKQYNSLFDCFYLDILRKLHEKYGAKFALNVFFQTPENDFDLAQFPDRYKGQWRDNSDWLTLAFHAYAEFPDRPYLQAEPDKLAADFDRVAEQIVRFAGEQAYSPPTVIHWAVIRPDALPVLAERGVRVLSTGLWWRDKKWDINYVLDDAQCEYLSTHDALKDFESGIIFSNSDITCNNTPVDQTVPVLQKKVSDPNTAEIIDLFTHEQYFWNFYYKYVPDHAERLDAAIRWASENGYEPVFFHEGLLGGKDW